VAEFAYITGWRVRSEVLALEWRNVDWNAREMRLEPGTTKNGDGRTFPFTAALETLLKAQDALRERLKQADTIVPYVFHRNGRAIRDFRKAWETATTKAGVPGRFLHDFRRTAVRNLELSGVPRATAMVMVGHKTERIYRRYAIVDATSLRDAAAKIDAASARLEHARAVR
jgi:integrase